ncbi:TadE/TadG family type IV pilus assembly protein, partial [Phytoactinopolyspora endophytica]|uniref:TadE/TadG family type IV pilus assembly protein n=1 Tax=Phytoactinopolyspora endophytica TaxID=1642495 RepID=UPI00101C17DA
MPAAVDARPPPARHHRTGGRRPRSERGAGTVQLVVATPLLMLLLLCIVQFAVWSHATHIAQSAAAQGLAAARVADGTETAGHTVAQGVLDQLADGPLHHASVTVTRSATVAVRISGVAARVVPGLQLPVH